MSSTHKNHKKTPKNPLFKQSKCLYNNNFIYIAPFKSIVIAIVVLDLKTNGTRGRFNSGIPMFSELLKIPRSLEPQTETFGLKESYCIHAVNIIL